MNILFVTHPYPNYVPDLLLHGFRKLLGSNVVDFPRKECLYDGILGLGVCPEDQLCPDWFPHDNGKIDRNDINAKIRNGYFKYIICDVRAFSFLQTIAPECPRGLVVLDGEDFPVQIQPGSYVVCRRETDGADFSIPVPMSLPEEIMQWIVSYDTSPKSYSIGFLGSTDNFYDERRVIIEQIATLYPDCLLKTSEVPSEGNPNPSQRMGRNDYYMNLQKCKIVLSLRGAGYDTFRFWENTACNGVHISQKMPLFVPNDFENGRHILRFSYIDELRKLIDDVLGGGVDTGHLAHESRSHLSSLHLTTKRAVYLIDRLNRIFG